MKKIILLISSIVIVLIVGLLGVNQWTGAEEQVFYVPNAGEGTISVVSSKGKIADTISLGTSQASHGIALSADGKSLYAGTGFEGKSLVAVDTTTKEIQNTLTFAEGVHGIDISPNGNKLFVSLIAGLGETGGGLAIVNAKTLEQESLIDTQGGPAHVAITRDGSQAWVANVNGDTVAVIDAIQNRLLKVILVGKVPNEVAVTPDGKWAFVANVESDSVTVIDIGTLTAVKEITAGDAPHGVTVSPNGEELWVSNNKSNDVTIIAVNTLETLATISTGAYANHVAFSADGKWAYVTNRQSNDIVKIDALKKKEVARIPVGVEPHEISLEDYVSLDPMPTLADRMEKLESRERLRGTQVDGVDITVEWLFADALSSAMPPKEIAKEDFDQYSIFRISLTTHTGDLSSIPFQEKIILLEDSGEKKPVSKWIVASNDSHHPIYLALFPKTESSSQVSLDVGGLSDPAVQLVWK